MLLCCHIRRWVVQLGVLLSYKCLSALLYCRIKEEGGGHLRSNVEGECYCRISSVLLSYQREGGGHL